MCCLPLEIRRLSATWESALVEFFQTLTVTGNSKYFYPHPLNEINAKHLSQYVGKDLYYILVEGEQIIGYGILRGWDEGYSVPSLGIAILPEKRGAGLGMLFMHFLHTAARRMGAKKIRLKVHKENESAKYLYEKLGYKFSIKESDQFIGIFHL